MRKLSPSKGGVEQGVDRGASRQKEQFRQRHDNRTTDCLVGRKERPGVSEVDTGKRFGSQI